MEKNKNNSNRNENEKKQNEKKQFIIGIKLKLIIGFAIPLICTIIVGVAAYSKAASGMISNYENSISKALSMAMEYLDFGFESAVSESEQLYYDTDLVRWATGAIYNEWRKQEIEENIAVDLSVKQRGNSFIANMYIIPNSNMNIVSTQYEDQEIQGFYQDLEQSNESACLTSLKGNWIGTHNYIDQVLLQHNTDYSIESYACSYIRPMTTKRACIVVDYSSEAIANILKDLDLGEESISAFITADGRELLLKGSEVVKNYEFSFLDQSYYKEAMSDTAAIIIDYITYQNEEYLFLISKSYKNGSAICTMVPVSIVNVEADSIKNMTILMVILSCAVALLVSIFIIVGIVSTIRQISSRLQVVSEGDLTVTINTNRRDEFKILVKSIADMIKNSRNLIIQVLKTSENVSESTGKLMEASKVLTSSNNQIALAVEEMDQGLNQQSANAQNCLLLMDELSNRIILAEDAVKRMTSIIGDTKEIIGSGVSTMDELSEKSSDTTNITKNVTSNIKNLEESLSQVEKFVELINGIAEETSLLSLNASIEAAKAGEAGRGFVVVAQSVSKLSENTIQAADQIYAVMKQIKDYANDTVKVAGAAEQIVSNQTGTVTDTIQVFKDMNEYVENLMGELNSLEEAIENMEQHRRDTLSAIESISSVSEETVASISVVNDSLKKQMTMVDNLHGSTVELEDKAKVLTDAVNVFKI